jgi:hypothetical protein
MMTLLSYVDHTVGLWSGSRLADDGFASDATFLECLQSLGDLIEGDDLADDGPEPRAPASYGSVLIGL